MLLHTALLAATLPLSPTGEAQLLPFGEFAARDGRPGPGKTWKVSNERGHAIAADMNVLTAQTAIVIDYDHQTISTLKNGKPAPAAGWINSVNWRDGRGMYSDVDWTAAARTAIDGGEYRYISPVIEFDADGNVTGVLMAALTNFPAIVGMDRVIAELNTQIDTEATNPVSAMAQLSRLITQLNSKLDHQQHQESDMHLLAALCALMALPATTSEDDALAAVTTLKAKAESAPPVPTALSAALGLQAGATEAAALSAVNALRTADTNTLVTLQTQLNALTAQINAGVIDAAVDDAIAAGKLTPANRQLYVDLGRKDRAQLTSLIAAMPVIPGLAGNQSGGKDPNPAAGDGAASAALTSAEAATVSAAMGIAPAEWIKALTKT